MKPNNSPHDVFWARKIKKYREVNPIKKRFDFDPSGVYIVDKINGNNFDFSDELLDLMNRLNDRADRNAELVDMEKIELIYQRDMYQDFTNKVCKIMDKYGIDSLKKLDLVLFHQRLW